MDKIIQTDDLSDPCDFCSKPATMRAHILFVCHAHGEQLASEIKQVVNPGKRPYVICPHGMWEEECQEHYKTDLCSQGGSHEFIDMQDKRNIKQCQKCNLKRVKYEDDIPYSW